MRRAHAQVEGRGQLTLDDIAQAMREAARVRIVGNGSRSNWLPAWAGATVVVPSGIVAHDVADQVVQAWAGTTVEELQAELATHGQCLPLADALPDVYSQRGGTVGGLLATNLPHALSSQSGGPRDWAIGMTVVRADGTVAKCGSKAVKSVAGYDVHKLFVGSRGTLGAIASVMLRTFPLAALPSHTLEIKSGAEPNFIARTLRTDFDAITSNAEGLTALDSASCTFWTTTEPPLPPESWMIGVGGMMKRAQQPEKFESRARQVFDPTSKLALGWTE
jgi:glycolate oxidase FAD binding subunit